MNDTKSQDLSKALAQAMRGLDHALAFAEMPKESRQYITECWNFADCVRALCSSPDTLTAEQKEATKARLKILSYSEGVK